MQRLQLDNVIALVNERICKDNYECIEAEWDGKDRTLRLFVDRKDKPGVDLSDCVRVTEALEDMGAIEDQIPGGTYALEVSSPGIERPLRLKAHFEANIGKTVQVKLTEKVYDRVFGKGKVTAVSPTGEITLETSRGPWSFPISSLKAASIVYNWNTN